MLDDMEGDEFIMQCKYQDDTQPVPSTSDEPQPGPSTSDVVLKHNCIVKITRISQKLKLIGASIAVIAPVSARGRSQICESCGWG